VRLLLAVPLLVVAELVVHQRMRTVVAQFLQRGLIPDSELATFREAVSSAMRLRNAIWVEALLIAVVYVVGVGIVWRTQALEVAGWPARRRRNMAAVARWLVAGPGEPAGVPVPVAALVFGSSSGRDSCGRCPASSCA
jgi:hypothetical protein